MKHTPLPWIIIESGYSERPDELLIESPREGKSNKRICEMGYDGVKKSQEDKANVHFIVIACNSHEELLEALKEAVDWIKRSPDLDSPRAKQKLNKLQQAISRTEGKVEPK